LTSVVLAPLEKVSQARPSSNRKLVAQSAGAIVGCRITGFLKTLGQETMLVQGFSKLHDQRPGLHPGGDERWQYSILGLARSEPTAFHSKTRLLQRFSVQGAPSS